MEEDADTILGDLVSISEFVLEKNGSDKASAVYMAELFQQLDEIMRLGDQVPEPWDN